MQLLNVESMLLLALCHMGVTRKTQLNYKTIPLHSAQQKNQSVNLTFTGKPHQSCILLMGGKRSYSNRSAIEFYHPEGESVCNRGLQTRRLQFATELIDTAVGIETSGCYLSATDQLLLRDAYGHPPLIFGLRDRTVSLMPLPYKGRNGRMPVHTRLSCTAAVSADRCVSCGGGHGGYRRLRECYVYIANDNRSFAGGWTPIARMQLPLRRLAAVVVGHDFYVIGARLLNNSMYRYAFAEERWHSEPAFPTVGCLSHAAAMLSDTELLVCGGGTEWTRCYVFDTVHRRWRSTGALRSNRPLFSMVNFNGLIYALGGCEQLAKRATVYSTAVEVYDAKLGVWCATTSLKHGRCSFVAVAV